MGSSLLGTIGWTISSIVSFIAALILTSAYLKRKERTVKYFAGFIWSRFVFFICLTLIYPLYVWTKSGIPSGIAITIFFMFVWIAILWLPSLFCSFQFPKLKNWFFGALVIVAIAGTIILVVNFTPAIFNPGTGIVFQAIPAIIGTVLYPIPKLLSLAPLMFLFLGKATEMVGRLRLRSLLIGLGFLAVITTIVVPTYLPPTWAGIYCCIGDILILAGVMTRPSERE